MTDDLARRFEQQRGHLRAVADRMLGDPAGAEDAVQEAWLRLTRVDAATIANLGGWLTTVVSRICLDMLRTRRARREEPADEPLPEPTAGGPEDEAVLVDAVGRALLVVLDRLGPEERVAFVLHDLFAVPFAEIAPVLDRSPDTTKKLASRGRGKVRGEPTAPAADLATQRRVLEGFLAASRTGDLAALLTLLAPDVVRRADRAAIPDGRPTVLRGARAVGDEITAFGRNARFAAPVLVDGAVGAAIAPHGRLRLVLTVALDGDQITEYAIIADPARLAALDLTLLP